MTRIAISKSGAAVALALLLATLLGIELLRVRLKRDHAIDIGIGALPKQLGAWQGRESVALDPSSREVLQLDQYLKRSYVHLDGKAQIDVYIGYWKRQSGDYQAAKHSPALCLPANGWKTERLDTFSFSPRDSNPITINRIVGEYGRERSLFYYWFFNGTDYYAEEWQSLLRVMGSALLGRRTDGGIIELGITLSGTNRERVEAVLQEFLREFLPAVNTLIRS